MKKQQIQQQEQMTAYDKKVTHDLFLITMEWLEKYIEIAYKNEFPDWESRKQIHDNNIKRTDIYDNPEKAENTLSTQLLLFESTASDKAPFIREEIKEEFYQWINAVRINAENCPERLKQFLFGIHEILEGRGEKIRKDVSSRKRLDSGSPEYMEQMKSLFVHTQVASREETKIEESLKGKIHKDIEVGGRFGSGNIEQGEKAFKGIAGTVSSSHDTGFHFFPQQGQQQRTNFEIIYDIRQNPRNWRIDEIIIDLGENRQEIVLIHQSARLDDYDQRTGKLNFDGNAIYQANRFSSEEQVQINQALNVSQSAQVQQPPYKWSWQ